MFEKPKADDPIDFNFEFFSNSTFVSLEQTIKARSSIWTTLDGIKIDSNDDDSAKADLLIICSSE